ncbi:hypothetical protein [Ovoidimarina sediminis]|uniref:hypothetical protein n=1 Tax=Ovoidimarina sediminis TaxID=3079856 RepID=UPI002911A473|nr:hypothetical protein [Rhodophyticola sp. MJ-SS7]MDU8946539.1 hypothetical protein [Rhodophyticola sp. MJ-SS7]
MTSIKAKSHPILALAAAAVLAGCAGVQDTTVSVPSHAADASGSLLASVSKRAVTVAPFTIDRGVGELPGRIGERTTVGDVTMGYVTLTPPPEVLFTNAISAELAAAGHTVSGGPSRVSGTVTRFALSTPATALYWDVTIDAAVAMNVNGTSLSYADRCVQRTYSWPSDELIGKLSRSCIASIASKFSRDRRAANAL